MNFKPHVYQEYATVSLLYDKFEVSKPLVVTPLRGVRYTWSTEKDKWDQFRYLKISKIIWGFKNSYTVAAPFLYTCDRYECR